MADTNNARALAEAEGLTAALARDLERDPRTQEAGRVARIIQGLLARAALAADPDAARQAEALRCVKCGSADIHTVWHGEGGQHPSRKFSTCREYGKDWGKPAEEHLHRTCRVCQFTWTERALAAAAGDTSEEDAAQTVRVEWPPADPTLTRTAQTAADLRWIASELAAGRLIHAAGDTSEERMSS